MERTKDLVRNPPSDLGTQGQEPGGVEVITPREGLPVSTGSQPIGAARAGEFEAIFQYAPLAMILLDPARVVWRLNRAACRLAGTTPERGAGQLPGALLLCAHLDETVGCGRGPLCEGCGLRRMVERSFATRQEAPPEEIDASFFVAGRPEARRLRICSSFLTVSAEPRTLLCIEDVTEVALPPGCAQRSLESAR